MLTDTGGPEVLRVVETDDPVPGPDDLLVDVAHTALNRADILQRMGFYPDPRRPAVEIPGMEYAGTVAAMGDRVTGWSIGDAVMGIETGGGYAERLVTNARQALPVPAGLKLDDAAAVPEVFLTAWDALVCQGGLTAGRWALIHAGASGVGTAGIQLCGALGARVAVTVSATKMDACRALGADVVLERSPADWSAGLRAELARHGRDGVDTILDVVAGDDAARNLAVVAPQGCIVQVGLMAGARVSVDLGALLAKRVRWVGTVLRSRPIEEKIALSQRFAREVLPWFASGQLKPVIDRRFGLADIGDAHRHMEANANIGKILVDVR
ncbi:MAG: NAD(P)H-quinone oxidoreductase [Desertimonas sp.]